MLRRFRTVAGFVSGLLLAVDPEAAARDDRTLDQAGREAVLKAVVDCGRGEWAGAEGECGLRTGAAGAAVQPEWWSACKSCKRDRSTCNPSGDTVL